MRASYLGLALLLLAPGEASAAHCGRGQIYRVHLRTCVSSRSALAHIAFRHRHRVRFTDLERDTTTPRHHHRPRHVGEPETTCDPASQCGDPIEDRVTETTTPRQEPP